MRLSRTYGHVLLVLCGTIGISVACAATGCGSDTERESFEPDGGSSGSSGVLGGSDSGNTFDSAFDPDAACASSTVTAKRARANILFIVDRSGSMNCNPPPVTTSAACEQSPATADNTKPTKWSITRDALKAAIGAMPAANSAGLTYFNVDNDCAVQATPNVPVKPIDATQIQLLGASLDNITPEGLTPIVGGVTLGYQYLHANTFVGRKYLVLLTDGQETCAGDQKDGFVSTTVTNAALVGIRTFVIGAPGSEPSRGFLSQIAFNGQTARTPNCNHSNNPPDVGDCHFDLTAAGLNLATELNAALDTISKEALSCEYEVPLPDGGTVDYGRVNVVYTPAGQPSQAIPQDANKTCLSADGWQYSPDRSRIILCGPACAKVKADQGGSVSVQLGCQTVVR